jgi:MFS family permease
LVVADYPRRSGARIEGNGFERIASGFRIAWHDRLVRRVLVILWTLSLFSLNFISFMAAHADRDIGIGAKSTAYGWLYASFGLGAALGAFGVGSFLAKFDKARLIRPALVAFSVLLFAFGVLARPAPAYPIAFALGFAYFAMITSLSTVLQSNIADDVRGRIMALWIMGFGGAVGLAALVWAPLADVSLRGVIVFGAAWAVVLAVLADPRALTRDSLHG